MIFASDQGVLVNLFGVGESLDFEKQNYYTVITELLLYFQ